jgi:hypothetical protein
MIIKIDQTKVDAQAKQARVLELKQLLADSDYIAMPDNDKSKPEILAQRPPSRVASVACQ